LQFRPSQSVCSLVPGRRPSVHPSRRGSHERRAVGRLLPGRCMCSAPHRRPLLPSRPSALIRTGLSRPPLAGRSLWSPLLGALPALAAHTAVDATACSAGPCRVRHQTWPATVRWYFCALEAATSFRPPERVFLVSMFKFQSSVCLVHYQCALCGV